MLGVRPNPECQGGLALVICVLIALISLAGYAVRGSKWRRRKPTWKGLEGEKYIRVQDGDVEEEIATSLQDEYGPRASLWLVVASRSESGWPELPIAGHKDIILLRRGATASARLVHLYPIRRAKHAIAVLTDITLNTA
jgi:hypothetical protein